MREMCLSEDFRGDVPLVVRAGDGHRRSGEHDTHFKNIYMKLGVRNRTAAVAKAMRLGVIN